jgi:hypothetical protein
MSKALAGEDAAVLALLAQEPRLPKTQRRELEESLSADARKIAKALNGAPPDRGAERAAEAFREWAKGLTEQVRTNGRRSGT